MAENVSAEQNSGLQETVAFSIALDESKGVIDVAHLAVIARYSDKNRIYEELCGMIPLSEARESEYGDLPLYSHVLWLSRGNVLNSVSVDGRCLRRGYTSMNEYGCGSLVVKLLDRGRLVTSSSPVPLKTRPVGQQCMLNQSRAQTSSHWYGAVVRRGGASSGVILVT
ncbi:hypothetical protein TNCV_1196931 [Trichonephila clavipes]|uniref:Uncharacterized protein n=1 Tax=Trichonephila clavipes TaxID=2585209 RepID=A0A8X6RZ92_TRICX|nr:hypothetical protein TNCV_1196931 [Trichonephila clavipes]